MRPQTEVGAQQGPLPSSLSSHRGWGLSPARSRPRWSHRVCLAAHTRQRPACAGCASRWGSGSVSAPALGSRGQLFALYLRCPMRRGGSGGQRAEAARRVAELGCSSPAASFGQATKSWPLSGSGLKFSLEVDAGICSAPCEMVGGGQRARGCGFVAANRSRRLCSLHKITGASSPSQALFPTLLGLKARGFTGRQRQTNLAPASIENLPSR